MLQLPGWGDPLGNNTGLRSWGCQVQWNLPQLKTVWSPQMKWSSQGWPRRARKLCRAEQRGELTLEPKAH